MAAPAVPAVAVPVAAPPAAAPPAAAPPAAAPVAAAPPAATAPAANPGPFTTIPPWVELKLPTKSRADELVKLRIKNPTGERVVYKVDATQPRKFMIEPKTGFIEAMAQSAVIELQPKNIAVGEMTSYLDKFVISIAASAADAANADEVWKTAQVKNVVHSDIRLIGL